MSSNWTVFIVAHLVSLQRLDPSGVPSHRSGMRWMKAWAAVGMVGALTLWRKRHAKECAMKKCEDLMTIDPQVISSEASALEASRMMRDNSIGFLPVCDPADGRLVAVVTDRDLVTRMCAADGRPSETRVVEVATTSPAVCQPEDPLDAAEFVMMSLDVSRVVIVDEAACPIGVLSLTDLIMNERGRRALHTARGVLEREAAGPQPPSENIELTASDPNAAVPATPQGPADETYEASGTAQSRSDYIAGGRERRAFKEFPG